MRPFRTVFGICLVAVVAGTANADMIGMNFRDSDSADIAADALAGVVPQLNWNNLQDPGNTVDQTFATLVDNGGDIVNDGTTDASLRVLKASGDTSNGTSGADQATPNNALISQGWGAKNGDPTIVLEFRNLSAAYTDFGFRIIVYSHSAIEAGGSGAARYAGTYTIEFDDDLDSTFGDDDLGVADAVYINHDTPAAAFDDPANDGSAFVNNQAGNGFSNYAYLDIPAGVSDFRIGVSNSGSRLWLNGAQIIAVPEPASLLLLAAGAGLMVSRRRGA